MFAPIWKGYFPEENHAGYVTNGVHLLRRVRIMNIQLGGLKTGEYRKVTGEEYKRLIKLLEGSTSLSEADRRGKRYVAFHPRKEDQVNKWKQRSRE